jgi:DNA-binding NtrC family response regulator
VLVVDDERSLAQAMARQLSATYDVELAHDGREARRALRERRFDVVLCDLRVPGLSGEKLFEEVVAEHPELAQRFVFVTGGLDAESAAFLARTKRPVLDKPFAAAELEKIVAEVAAARS